MKHAITNFNFIMELDSALALRTLFAEDVFSSTIEMSELHRV